MNGPVERVSATKRIAVTAHQIFLAVTDPAYHIKIDGSGMLRNAGAARRLKAAGDTFDIEMDRLPLGDLAGIASLPRYYTIRNTVTRIVPDRLLEWAPALAGKAPSGRIYGWEIQPMGDTACDVTNYCDWHAVSDELRARFTWPVVPASALERSVENLARMVTQP
jgi:hypothetical protein